MGATVVDTSLKAATWEKVKPKDYKNGDLSKALKALEGATKSSFSMPADVPGLKLSEIEACIKTLEAAKKDLKPMVDAMGGVADAAKSTAAELLKLAKDKEGKDKGAYEEAKGVAATMATNAAKRKKEMS
ncbi:MAG: hypothetical protein KF887_13870 [Paracoccaceae bacterium]|nr:MAG: hypothetical protein KF887_13870 [Paracoccaceae bacterium]